jgi:type I restriction enzyme R subunit
MNEQMKRWLAGAIFIGFTATPLLRDDKKLTREVFGTYIHTYKFHQAVADKVVLDLKYEARNVPQRLSSPAAVDKWFERKTQGLNAFQKARLRSRWATMEQLMCAAERKQRVIASIIEDFSLKPRLNNDRGTAILVVPNIYDACHYFRLFHQTDFGRFCGIITSYEPNPSAISREPSNSDERYKFDTYTKYVLGPDQTTTQYEYETTRQFIEEPANLKLLIVVGKLLTGFDAPSCTYIYLDNELHELFVEVQETLAVYSSDALDTDVGDGGDNNIYLKDWLVEGRKKLNEAREALRYLCGPVPPPREIEQFLHYFCGSAANPDALNKTEPLRVELYRATASLVRAFASIAQELATAGFSDAESEALRKEVRWYSELRAAIKRHSGEELDIKPYEADMRQLLNMYIQADPAAQLGQLANLSLTELIIHTNIHDAIAHTLNATGRLSRNAVAEGVINNLRKTIIRERPTDPRFYDQMSKLLEDLIKQSVADAAAYETFLRGAEALATRLVRKQPESGVPAALYGLPEATAIYNNLPDVLASGRDQTPSVNAPPVDYGDKRVRLALEIDRTLRERAPAGWRGDQAREIQVLNVLFPLLDRNRAATEALFEIVKNQPGYQ